MQNLKSKSGVVKKTKIICSLNKKDSNYDDPIVDLEIEVYHVRQVFLDFKSQANIMAKDTWEQLGKSRLKEFDIYLKLVKIKE